MFNYEDLTNMGIGEIDYAVSETGNLQFICKLSDQELDQYEKDPRSHFRMTQTDDGSHD